MKKMDNRCDNRCDKCDRHDRYILSGGCATRTCEEARVTVPVAVRACAVPGNVEIRCHGPAVINRNSNVCPGVPNGCTIFTISQRIRMDIPVEFKAELELGDSCVQFATGENEPDCGCGNR